MGLSAVKAIHLFVSAESWQNRFGIVAGIGVGSLWNRCSSQKAVAKALEEAVCGVKESAVKSSNTVKLQRIA